MKILLDANSVALYFDGFVVNDDCIDLGIGCNWGYNASNTSVIDAPLPDPALPNVWKWEGGAWVCVDQPMVDAFLASKKAELNAAQKQKRAEAYRNDSDPLFFKAQRGEATIEEWQAKVSEIVARYPYMT